MRRQSARGDKDLPWGWLAAFQARVVLSIARRADFTAMAQLIASVWGEGPPRSVLALDSIVRRSNHCRRFRG